MSSIIRVFGALACLGVLAGCAAGFHTNSTEQGLRAELGIYPTESSGDFNAKVADADTRAVYAAACDRARQPAACLEAMSLGMPSDQARRAYYWRGRRLRYYASGCGRYSPFADSARPDSGAGAADTGDEITRRRLERTRFASWTAALIPGPDVTGSMEPTDAALASHVAPPPADIWGSFVDRGQEARVAALMAAPRPSFGPLLEQLLAGPKVKCEQAPRYKEEVRQAARRLVEAWKIKCGSGDTTCLLRQEYSIQAAFREMELAVKAGYEACKADDQAANLFDNLQKAVEGLRGSLRPFLAKAGGVS